MCNIILPIKPKYSRSILEGNKTFELRRRLPKKKVDVIFIYETSPTMKVVGKINVKKTHTDSVEKIWKLTKNKNELLKKEFQSYFHDLENANAFEIENVQKFKKPKSISSFGLKSAPQGFAYIK